MKIVQAPKLIRFLRKNDIIALSILLAIVVAFVYGEVVFLGHTLSPATFSPGILGLGSWSYEGRRIAQSPMLDYWAAGVQNLPINRLVAEFMLAHQLPLWNPYMGAGTPLAGDTNVPVFAPTILFGLLGNAYDLAILFKIWLAGVFMIVFLRSLNLRRTSAFAGALFYMFSGAFTWYNGMSWIDVQMYAPLMMYGVELVVRGRRRVDWMILSISLLLTLLGGFIEVIILQFILALSYYILRSISQRKFTETIVHFLLGIFGGFGLAAFYLFLVFEYLMMSALGNPPTIGVSSLPSNLVGALFLPYILGGTSFWSNRALNFPSYVSAVCLFLAITSGVKWLHTRDRASLPAILFLCLGLLALLKTFGNPLVNWIGELPVLGYIIFYEYLGFFWALCLSAAAAFGLEIVLRGVRKRTLGISLVVAVLMEAAAFVTLAPFLSSTLPSYVRLFTSPLVNMEVSPTLLAAPVFLESILLITATAFVITLGRKVTGFGIVCLVVLEMSNYLPRGLPYSWEVLQCVWISASAIVLVALVAAERYEWRPISIPHLYLFPRPSSLRAKKLAISLLLIVSLLGLILISHASVAGLPDRYDDFREPPYVPFLKAHIGYYRMYSIEYTVMSTFPGVYGLQTVGIVSAFNVDIFDYFARTHLDTAKHNTNLDSQWLRPWPTGIGNASVDEFRKNLPFFDLLGVKYIVARSNLTRLLSFPLAYNGEASIYENPGALPRTFCLSRVQFVLNYLQAQQAISSSGFDPRTSVIVEDPSGSHAASQDFERCVASITSYEPNLVTIEVDNDHPAVLVLSDTYYPGWTSQIDAQNTPIYRADALLRSVIVPPGHHIITFRYLPESFLVGMVVTVTTSLVMISWCFYPAARNGLRKFTSEQGNGTIRRKQTA